MKSVNKTDRTYEISRIFIRFIFKLPTFLGHHEIFGPVLAIIAADDFEQALAIANDVKFGLSAAIFTKNIDQVFAFLNGVEAGLIKINGETAGVEPHAPFGGFKESSINEIESLMYL